MEVDFSEEDQMMRAIAMSLGQNVSVPVNSITQEVRHLLAMSVGQNVSVSVNLITQEVRHLLAMSFGQNIHFYILGF